MKARMAAFASIGFLAPPLFCGTARAQNPPAKSSAPAAAQPAQAGPTTETIDVTGARPVAKAMDVIEKRYGVLIDYVDPQYAAPQDIDRVSYRPGHITPIPKVRTLSLEYRQVSGRPDGLSYLGTCNAATLGCAPVVTKPEVGITGLIRRILNQYAVDGGQVFLVKKLKTPYATRWEVYPEEARGRSGAFVYQPDVLSTVVDVPSEPSGGAMLGAVCEQLSKAWGHKFGVASAPTNEFVRAERTMPLEDVSAWEAFARMTGPSEVLRLFYAPDDGMYYINIVNIPYREPPRPPTPAAVPARTLPAHPYRPDFWLLAARLPKLILDVQNALVKAGYLHTAPTGQWDAGGVGALRRFQIANGLPGTGKLDLPTITRLTPFLPEEPARVIPARPAMDYALAYWQGNTSSGRKEIQEALTKAGFYSGPLTGEWDLGTRKAVKAFQAANGLQPNGILGYQSLLKLTPYLPK